MDEFGVEIDDVRWYLSSQLANDIVALHNQPRMVVELIWSGKLGDRLYQMEDRYLEELESQWDLGLREETRIREIMSTIRIAKRRRR